MCSRRLFFTLAMPRIDFDKPAKFMQNCAPFFFRWFDSVAALKCLPEETCPLLREPAPYFQALGLASYWRAYRCIHARIQNSAADPVIATYPTTPACRRRAWRAVIAEN